MEFAGIGDDDQGPEAGEVTADPRAVRARFNGHGGGGILGEQQREGHAVIEQGAFVEDLAGGIEDAEIMAAITKIKADGKPAGRNRDGRGSGNDGRSVSWFVSMFFHRQRV